MAAKKDLQEIDGDTKLSAKEGHAIKVYEIIKDLNNEDVDTLAQRLGLLPATITHMKHPIHMEVAKAWLMRRDNVITECPNGKPTWRELARKLQDMGQIDMVEEIKEKHPSGEAPRKPPPVQENRGNGNGWKPPTVQENRENGDGATPGTSTTPPAPKKVEAAKSRQVTDSADDKKDENTTVEEIDGTIEFDGKSKPGGSKPGDMDTKKPNKYIGAAIILTNEYENVENLKPLPATRYDGEDLKEALSALAFDVYWTHNATKTDLTEYIKKVKQLERNLCPKYRCIIFIICGHGDTKKDQIEILKMANGEEVEKNKDLIEALFPEKFEPDDPEEIPKGLGGIPKVFLFEACRGRDLQPIVNLNQSRNVDEKNEVVKIAKGGNHFVGEATNKSYVALDYGSSKDKEKRGGWWFHEVCTLLRDQEKRYLYSLEALLTEATRVLMYKMNKNPEDYKVAIKDGIVDGFVQPVRTSLLNQNICLDPQCPGGKNIFKQENGRAIETFCDHK